MEKFLSRKICLFFTRTCAPAPGETFLLVLYTTNSKGRSQEVRLEALTLDKDSVGKGKNEWVIRIQNRNVYKNINILSSSSSSREAETFVPSVIQLSYGCEEGEWNNKDPHHPPSSVLSQL